MYLETTTSNRTSKLVANLIMLSQDTTCIVLPEICLIYINMLKYYTVNFLRTSVHYVARGSELCALERPRASGISWDSQTLSAVTCIGCGHSVTWWRTYRFKVTRLRTAPTGKHLSEASHLSTRAVSSQLPMAHHNLDGREYVASSL